MTVQTVEKVFWLISRYFFLYDIVLKDKKYVLEILLLIYQYISKGWYHGNKTTKCKRRNNFSNNGIISPEYSLDVPYYIVKLIGVNEIEEGYLATAISSDDSRIFTYTVRASDYYYIWVYYSDESPYITGGSYMLYIWWDWKK